MPIFTPLGSDVQMEAFLLLKPLSTVGARVRARAMVGAGVGVGVGVGVKGEG
jgi:hypothetical protein